MSALDHLMAGAFDEAITAYQTELVSKPDDGGATSGLAHAYMGAGRYEEAIPWEWRVHERAKARNPDSPGELLYLSCAHWCLEDRNRAIELARELCASILDRTVSMAPDQAGGATFGLILHYMSVTGRDDANRDYALEYLRKLNVKYDKQPTLFRYPVQTVKQLLGEVAFEDALEGATKERSLAAACRAAESNRSFKLALGVVLFHDGLLRRVQGDEVACADRMKQVFDLGYQTEAFRWYLARHEVAKPNRD
jgi:tetratricopeptide (TPR) repeat protein